MRTLLRVGVINDYMSVTGCLAMSESFLFATHPGKVGLAAFFVPAGRNFPPRSLPPAGFGLSFVMVAFIHSLAKRLISCITVSWARFVVSQECGPEKAKLDGAAKWPS